MIISNQAKCLKCGDEPFSQYRHDFKYCECGNIFVDGGMSYVRHGMEDRESYMDLSIHMDDMLVDTLLSSLQWCRENHRNDLGRLCHLLIALRDSGYKVVEDE